MAAVESTWGIPSDQVFAAFNNIGFEQAAGMKGDTSAAMFGAMDAQQIGVFLPSDVLTVVEQMQGSHFEFMDSDSAFDLFQGIGLDQAIGLGGGELAGMFGAMNPTDIGQLGSFGILSDAVANIQPGDFQFMDDDSGQAIFSELGVGQALSSLEGGRMAGMFGAMTGDQIRGFESGDVSAIASSLSGEDFDGLGSDSAFGMFESLGLPQVLGLQGSQLTGLVSNFDSGQFADLGGDSFAQIVGGLDRVQLAGLGNQQAFGMASNRQPDQFSNFGSGKLFGLTTAMNASDIENLGGEILGRMVQGFESGDLSALDNDRAGRMFSLVGDEIIAGFDSAHAAATLDALEANFFGAGATGFDGIAGGSTVFNLIDFEVPDALANLLTGEKFENPFGGNLFGGN